VCGNDFIVMSSRVFVVACFVIVKDGNPLEHFLLRFISEICGNETKARRAGQGEGQFRYAYTTLVDEAEDTTRKRAYTCRV
jgi:hypothetical protein